jgi:hypothetical protein
MEKYSDKHGNWYGAMAREMIRNAGFQKSVNDKLQSVDLRDGCYGVECQWVDDLYEIYGGMDVIDD